MKLRKVRKPLDGKHEKENVCIDCKHYEACGKPERFMRCLGYEKAVNAERKDNDR